MMKEGKNWHTCGWHAPLASFTRDEVGVPPLNILSSTPPSQPHPFIIWRSPAALVS